jgi:hypothetical protein
MDPLAGPNDETRRFTLPQQPIRRRLTELPQFVVNRGGEYLFMPGRRAIGWIAGWTRRPEGDVVIGFKVSGRPALSNVRTSDSIER